MALRRILESSRFLAIIAVIGMLATSLATFGWSIARTVLFVSELFDGKWRSDIQVVSLLKVIDTYLLALVQLIIAIGLYELFVGSLNVPEWLRIESLDDLKKSIVDILVVFVAVKGIEGLLKQGSALQALTFVGAAASLILVLTLFRLAKVAGKKT
jgi:uncharacterized membrane protein YqhA